MAVKTAKEKVSKTPKNTGNFKKGGSLMKKVVGLFLALSAVIVLVGQVVYAGTEKTVNIDASATVTGYNDIYYQVKNISNGLPGTDILFGTIGRSTVTWNTKPQQYVDLSINDNYIWELRLYTNNFTTQPSSVTWGTQYGGLVGPAGSGAKVGMGWMVLPDESTNIFGGPGVGDPSTGTVNGWTYIKDYYDIDDPDIDGDNSFSVAVSTGYCNIAYGVINKTYIIRPNVNLADLDPDNNGQQELLNPNDHFYLYFEGNFGNAYPAIYSGNLELELYHK